MRIVYRTAATLNGFLATPDHSLDWLFAVPEPSPDLEGFMSSVTVLVMGSSTYEWVLRSTDALAESATWTKHFGGRPVFVFSTRVQSRPHGADVRVVAGPVDRHLDALAAAAGEGTVWVQGGGELAGQFLDAGALDEIAVTVAPAVLTGGAPLLPRTLGADRLHLTDVARVGEFADLTYSVTA